MNLAAIYTRVSSDRQKEDQTIESQVSALKEFAAARGYTIPEAWCFKDDGYSGALLIRPGLERLRDLSAEGQIAAVLIYSPDRLSRKYAYQVLLMEEFSRCGVQVIFLKSPKATTPEEHLLLQFQGMISEYERAQIVERTRRGKKHRAKMGVVNVLSRAPYGYRYVKKSEGSNASYEIVEDRAEMVRQIFHDYAEVGRPMLAMARSLNQQGIPTSTGKGKWAPSSIRNILRNPAYKGQAAFGRHGTKTAEPNGMRRRWRGKPAKGLLTIERPSEEWISVSVPSIISVEVFDLAQERLKKNKHYAARNTQTPTLLQGLLVCALCGHAIYRVSAPKTSSRGQKLHYYRCFRSQRYRMGVDRVCPNRPIRQDYLDGLVWSQIVQLLENPELIRAEIARRVQQARQTSPVQTRKESLAQEQIRIKKGMDRLLDAYQEGLLPLAELRQRIPDLKKRDATIRTELQSLETIVLDEQRRLELSANLEDLLKRLHKSAASLELADRQKILRLIVKEVVVSPETVTIKHSIPIIQGSTNGNEPNYQLCTNRQCRYPPRLFPARRRRHG